jgi:hypothetical protein
MTAIVTSRLSRIALGISRGAISEMPRAVRDVTVGNQHPKEAA